MKNKTTINFPQAIETIRTKKGTYLNIQAEDGSWIEAYLNVKDGKKLITKVQHDMVNVVHKLAVHKLNGYRKATKNGLHGLQGHA